MSKLYAVYGSLRKGLGNHGTLGNAPMVGVTKTDPEFTMVSLGGFPGVVKGGNTSITLEVYEVKNPTIEQNLDWLEGYEGPNNEYNFYNKELINTEFGKAYIYYLNDDVSNDPIVESGDWYEFKKN